jgi:outer membrane protein assembly factor BamA
MVIGLCWYVGRAYCQQGVAWCVVVSADSVQWKAAFGGSAIYAVRDSAQAVGQVDSLVGVLRRKGHWEASVDRCLVQGNILRAWVHVGARYQLQAVTLDSVVAVHYAEWLPKGYDADFEGLERAKKQLRTAAGQRGYPLAKVYVDSVVVTTAQTVRLRLCMAEGRLYVLDEFRHDSIVRVRTSFLANYLSWKKGAPYNKDVVEAAYKRLKLLPYIGQVQKPHIVLNTLGGADLVILGKDKPISRFDGILGIAPNAQTGKAVLTGNVLLDLQNALGRGERLAVRWQQLRPFTQDLEVNASYPYLFNTPFGITADLTIVKMDSTYIDIAHTIAADYRISGINYLRLGWGTLNTNLLQADTNYVKQYHKLPTQVGTKQQALTLEAFWNNTDNFWLPRRGISSKIQLWWGNKQIQRSAAIEQLTDELGNSYARLYDSLQLQTFQIRMLAQTQYHWALAPNHTWTTGLKLGTILSPQPLFANEWYRLGGIRSIRGFAEASIPAQQYAILTGEYKLFFNELSYFNIFSDLCITVRKVDEQRQHDTPIGLGAGMALASKAGTFQIQYALGTQQGIPLQFNNSKIHLGYINTF